jgi:hypothetical protein
MNEPGPDAGAQMWEGHLVLDPAHYWADRSSYRADSVPIRLSAGKAADSETY